MNTETFDPRTILLLGAGELGKELAIAAQQMGVRVVAVDRYDDAPAMQVAHAREVVSMLDATAVEGAIRTHRPDLVIPELKRIRTERLAVLEDEGFRVVPSVEATRLTMDRERIRRLAAEELGLKTAAYAFADSEEELVDACDDLGYPCVVKPIMSYSGRGQSVVLGPARVERAWAYAREEEAGGEGAGDEGRVIVEEFIEIDHEFTLLVVREHDGAIRFIDPVGHRQEQGDYQESWMPAEVSELHAEKAREMALVLTDRLGGAGLYGAEFFAVDDDVLFSAVSPGPHESGLVTLVSQDLSQFELHLRAALGLPVPAVRYHGPSAAAVIPARSHGRVAGYEGLDRALLIESARVRIFGKPMAHPRRRMGVTLASGDTVEEARARALEAAARIEVRVE